eukprot:gene5747-7610_t
MRGHNEPGGGFVAGLVLSTAFLLQYIVSGTRWVETHMPLRPPIWIASGLLIATATGAGALLLGYPFLTTHTAHLYLPWIGELHVASALFYDIGVFTLVVGSTLLILTALGHQSLRGHRRAVVHEDHKGEACGVWLVLRPRTYQVIIGFCLLGYGVNLFIFSMGRLAVDSEPILVPELAANLMNYTDPMPQALVLTAIVIGF